MTKRKPLVFKTSFADVSAEVAAVLDRHGRQPDLGALASIVINNHPGVTGPDRDFHLCCSFRAIRKEISEQLNKRRRMPDGTDVGDGFAMLKEGYNIERDGQQLHLPLEKLTFEDLMAKGDEYIKKGGALVTEGRALQRFAFERFPQQAAEYRAAQADR